jgi:hypothetical protein
MAIQLIEISVPGEIPSLVEINGGDGPQIVEINQGAQGEPGEQGSPGPNVVNTNTQTTLTGLLKGDGNYVGEAIPNEDYLTPTGDGSGLTGLKVTRVFSDQVEANSSAPDFSGQLAYTRSESSLIAGQSQSIGDWSGNFAFGSVSATSTVSGSNIDASGNVAGNAATATAALGLKTATGTVSISSATAPTGGQALVATSGTSATWQTPTVAVGSITGLGTGVATALAVNVSSAGAFVTFNGALGTPSSGTLTNCTIPASAITGTTLASSVVTSSLTSVGTLTGLTLTGAINAPAGTASAPSINFGNSSTGIYQSATDRIGFTAGGSLKVVIYSNGMYMNAGAFGVNGVNWFRIGTGGVELTTTAAGGVYAPLTVSNLIANGSLSASSLTLTGTPLAAGSGGTGLTSLGTGVATFLQTPTSANLAAAVTNETGSGSLVFADSPTFSTGITVAGSNSTGVISATTSSSAVSISVASLLAASSTGDVYFSVGKALTNTNSALIGYSTTGATAPYAFMTTYGRAASDLCVNTNGSVGMGTATPSTKAKLEISSTTQGFLPPRMTTTQRDAITSPPEGLEIYNSTLKKKQFFNGTSWETVTSS